MNPDWKSLENSDYLKLPFRCISLYLKCIKSHCQRHFKNKFILIPRDSHEIFGLILQLTHESYFYILQIVHAPIHTFMPML